MLLYIIHRNIIRKKSVSDRVSKSLECSILIYYFTKNKHLLNNNINNII